VTAQGFTQPVTEMSTRGRKIMFLRSGARPVRRADRFTAICKRFSRQCGILNSSQAYRPPRPVTGIVLLFLYTLGVLNVTEIGGHVVE
jgi:hypothetical protein